MVYALQDLSKIGWLATKNVTSVISKSFAETAAVNSPSSKNIFKRLLAGLFGIEFRSPLTLPESLSILGIEKLTDPLLVRKRSEKLWEDNNPEKGGSVYLQEKILLSTKLLLEHLEKNPPQYHQNEDNQDSEIGNEKEN
ncbi:import inner membrane translocase subunit tim16 [Anaeramoeba flamelloides]|uniref:Import inner membrane translocase subunit tim16 n=1 Tax=Anaeramoeba flamelloides TaxID=1746091 RepID=A0AAV7ZGC3_9EUKA|nr:import inner membrane translocase subunit tim16 [Anaeramoeba flamelloides]KAJ6248763.1 import inner membrane translocase subunit tim16 [Anaeramoeba flamelloides]